MLAEITKTIEGLSEENLDRFIRIIVNNPSLGALNHAYLFNQGNVEHTVMPESSIDELKRKVTGNEAMIFLPVYKENLSYGKIKVKEVRTRKRALSSTNMLLRFFKAFDKMPKESSFVPEGRLGFYNEEDGEVYISPFAGRDLIGNKELVNKAILEIFVDLLLANAGIKNEEYAKLVGHIVLVGEGFDRRRPELDINELKSFMDTDKMILLSNVAKKCHYLNETVMLDMEEVMLLRILLNKEKEETLRILESLSLGSADLVLTSQLEELHKKVDSTNEDSYKSILRLKEERKLHIHLRLQGYFDARKYFNS